MNKETLIEKLLNEKAEKNNTIDLNAYALGLDAMYEALVLYGVIQRSEHLRMRKINNMLKTKIQKQITLDFIKWKEKTKLEYINGTIRGKDENGNDVREFFSKILKDDDALFDYWLKLPKQII